MQRRFKSTKDGEYTLIIGGRNMSIYCHGMAGKEPKEYLTLPAGDKENFAEIYDKRWYFLGFTFLYILFVNFQLYLIFSDSLIHKHVPSVDRETIAAIVSLILEPFLELRCLKEYEWIRLDLLLSVKSF